MVKKIVVTKILSDKESADLEGKWIDESHIKHPIINSDTDVYRLDDNNNEILYNFTIKVIEPAFVY